MLSLLTAILTVVGATGGAAVGAALYGKSPRAIPAITDPEPYCGCTHHLAKHDRTTGRCHATCAQPVSWHYDGTPDHWEHVPCTCRQYIGPEPMPTFYAPPLTPGLGKPPAPADDRQA